jgi:hypothetical protein
MFLLLFLVCVWPHARSISICVTCMKWWNRDEPLRFLLLIKNRINHSLKLEPASEMRLQKNLTNDKRAARMRKWTQSMGQFQKVLIPVEFLLSGAQPCHRCHAWGADQRRRFSLRGFTHSWPRHSLDEPLRSPTANRDPSARSRCPIRISLGQCGCVCEREDETGGSWVESSYRR